MLAQYSTKAPNQENLSKLPAEKREENQPLIVLKLGSSILAKPADYEVATHEIYRWIRKGYRVLAVVSAMGSTTDDLLEEAAKLNEDPKGELLANFLATGEWTSCARLGLVLDKAGIACKVLTSEALGIQTSGPVLDAVCQALDPTAIQEALAEVPVVVAPGFVGIHENGSPSLLGRGGTDLSAIFLAKQLAASRCFLIKDVDGLYDKDPHLYAESANRFEVVHYQDVLQLPEGIIQHKAVAYAKDCGMPFFLGSALGSNPTCVSASDSRFSTQQETFKKRRVFAVGRREICLALQNLLEGLPQLFEEFRFLDTPSAGQISKPETKALEEEMQRADVLVDLGWQAEFGLSFATLGLNLGKPVISANTACIATHGAALNQRSQSLGVPLMSHATVGGVVPILERLKARKGRGRIFKIEALLNTTSNVILERLSMGDSWSCAMEYVQRKGLTQPHVQSDIEGINGLEKLIICANLGLDLDLHKDAVQLENLELLATHLQESDFNWDVTLKQVCSLEMDPSYVRAGIQAKVLDTHHPLAHLKGDVSGFVIYDSEGGVEVLVGKGSGSFPVAQAVTADLIELATVASKQG